MDQWDDNLNNQTLQYVCALKHILALKSTGT